jgi:hypothetical protein
MARAMTRLQEAAIGAAECLCEVQTSGESESARVSAARTILEQALRAVELQDIQGRLDKLEQIPRLPQKGDYDQPNFAAPGTVGKTNGPPQ